MEKKKTLSDSSGCVPAGKHQDEDAAYFFFFYNFTLLRKPEINLKSDREISQVRQSWRMADVL